MLVIVQTCGRFCLSPQSTIKRFKKCTYLHVGMATKTLTITEEAYERLAMMKNERESFSQAIVRRFPKPSLLAIAGILSEEETHELENHIRSRRSASRKRFDMAGKMLN